MSTYMQVGKKRKKKGKKVVRRALLKITIIGNVKVKCTSVREKKRRITRRQTEHDYPAAAFSLLPSLLISFFLSLSSFPFCLLRPTNQPQTK